MVHSFCDRPIHDVGIGLRTSHYRDIHETRPDISWFEILSDNYLALSGLPHFHLMKIREHYPVAMHSVGMSLGSCDPLNVDYLQRLKNLAACVEPQLISDHVCWISYQQHYFHELLPLPYTEESVKHVVDRIQRVQDFLGQRIAVENVSSYLTYSISTLSEWEFLNAVAQQADCLLLLDINNVYVSASNHDFDPQQYINNIDATRIKQFHLAGFEDHSTHLLDSHGANVCEDVWALFRYALKKIGNVPTLLERDNNIPSLSECMSEIRHAQDLIRSV